VNNTSNKDNKKVNNNKVKSNINKEKQKINPKNQELSGQTTMTYTVLWTGMRYSRIQNGRVYDNVYL